ncbi:cytochrome b6 [Alicyclobacillaceae bacterium I2511]|nr:cytochrome b6 [Alicyclobacillaceae bacterium I2511]
MLRKVYDWIDERISVTPLWRDVAQHEVPAHVNPTKKLSAFMYCFGGLTFLTIVTQFLSGIFLAMFYTPDIKNAWYSVNYITNDVLLGNVVRGMHFWGASLVIIIMILHMLRVFFTGAYKKPRELNWVLGVLIFIVILALGFTGYLLPWDQKAYWATSVGSQIAGAVPWVGTYIQTLLVGGHTVGALTLTRFYAIHVFFLPAALMVLLGVHFVMIRLQGIAGPL